MSPPKDPADNYASLLNPTWENLDAFYDRDERRRFSPEDDLGRHWHMEDHVRYRLSYLVATGEIVMVNEDTGWTELLGWAPTSAIVAKVFKDWHAHCGRPKGYYWCRQQIMIASGHRGNQERKDKVHAGDEVTDELRNGAQEDLGTLF